MSSQIQLKYQIKKVHKLMYMKERNRDDNDDDAE